MKKTTKEVTPYKATVKVMGKTYESTGSSVSDALSKLLPKNCKGKSILIIQNGDVKKERILMPATTHRLFNTMGFSKEIALKNASILFQGI